MSMMQMFSYVLFGILISNVLGSIIDGNDYLNKQSLKSGLNDISNPNPDICSQEARCESVRNYTCFGTVLPYSTTSLSLAHDSISQLEIQENLALWQGLRSVPRCWAVVQPLLCSVYMPKCENNTLLLPSQEMCRITRGRCRAVEFQKGWPAFLQCENKKLFPPGCRNPLQEVKFNTTSKCIKPLVETDNPNRWYSDVEGCGLQCQNPLFSKEEHNQIHIFIKICAFLCFLGSLFTVLTCIISWEVSGRYPYIFIFYINACLCFAFIGWLVFSGFKEKTVCREDGTRHRTGENGESICVVAFFFIYCCLMTALTLFVILTQAWCTLFRQSGVSENVGKKQWLSLLVAAVAVSVVLALIVFLINGIEGDSVTGICFVGSSPSLRGGFLLLPVLLAAFIGAVFLSGGIYTLVNRKQKFQDGQMKKHIHCMIIRLSIFSFFSLCFVISTVVCHIYEFTSREEWEKSLRNYIVCLATAPATHVQCALEYHPNIYVLHLHLSSLFGFGILMASWTWTPNTYKLWRHFIGSIKIEKCCCFSINFKSIKEDPICMNLDINNNASCEVPPILPKFLNNRRNTITVVDQLGRPQYSSASDVSLQRISLDSFHQQNLDSLSQHLSEQEYAHVLRQQRRKTRRERKRYLTANRIAPWYPRSRRGSDTSVQSSIIVASMAAALSKDGKVTQATSTGDLNNVNDVLLPRVPTSYVINRPLVQRPTVPNLPFTHGMADNSNFSNVNPGGLFNPNGYGLTSQNSFAPLYNTNYSFSPQAPFGYLPNTMYPNILPSYLQMMASNLGCNVYNPMNFFPYNDFSATSSVVDHPESDLLPTHDRVDSSSEAEKTYLPIVMSESEFTDGPLSCDEALLAAERILQERALAQAALNIHENFQHRPILQPQSCAKTQFLKNIESAITLNTMEDNLCTKAPPPSPTDSDHEYFDDKLEKAPSRLSLKSLGAVFCSQNEDMAAGNFLQRVKSKIKRAASFSNGKEYKDNLELQSSQQCTSTHKNASKTDLLNKEQTQPLLTPHPLTFDKNLKLVNSSHSAMIDNVSR